jgi:hypothetical protein
VIAIARPRMGEEEKQEVSAALESGGLAQGEGDEMIRVPFTVNEVAAELGSPPGSAA